MLPNHKFRKTLLLIGGSGELGRVVTRRFAKTLLFRWNVFNIDATENPDATKNFIVDVQSQEPYKGDILERLKKEMSGFAQEYDAMINLAAIGKPPLSATLGGDSLALFDEWDRLRRAEIQSSLLLVHLAANYLSPNGYVALSGDLNVLDPALSSKQLPL